MPKFKTLDPDEVHVGRGRDAAAARVAFIRAIEDAEAGAITLEDDDAPNVVKRRLREAARHVGIKLRSSWDDSEHPKVLYWKRTQGSSLANGRSR